MQLILISMITLCLGGTFSLLFCRNIRFANIVGVGSTVLGCLIGLVPAVAVLWTGHTREFRMAWQVPFGSFSLKLDALSAFFLFVISILSAVAAIYGNSYLLEYKNRKNIGVLWFFFNILVTSMILVVVSHNGVLFLMAWEIMFLSSFFLVTFEDENENVRKAGWLYLVATHIGTVFIFILFILLAQNGPSLDFDHFVSFSLNDTSMTGLIFLLAVVGFGTKAGFIPLHVWLPEAHPVAPSHVSAVMSGVMIKTGIYGMLRTLTFLGRPELWWGCLLIVIGLSTGVLGVLFALTKHDLKRLLAYHSVENIGIIAIGLGLGVLGLSLKQPVLSVLGFVGGLLHVLNHALFKGLLFFCAGAVSHATGVRNIEQLGGLMRHMPWTGTFFLVGSFAICGLPPLNGFVSEFVIYVGAFYGMKFSDSLFFGTVAIIGLTIIGGLAVVCFTKAFGIIFLGEPRHTPAALRHEVGWGMLIPMLLLSIGCFLIGFLAPTIVPAMSPVVENITGLLKNNIDVHLAAVAILLQRVTVLSCVLVLILGCLIFLRRWLLSGKMFVQSNTWDCGFVKTTARMQYTASSYAHPTTSMFGYVLQTHRNTCMPEGFFPTEASLCTHTSDIFSQRFFHPTFRGIEWLFLRLHWLQHGRVQIYILYVAVTLLSILIWNLK